MTQCCAPADTFNVILRAYFQRRVCDSVARQVCVQSGLERKLYQRWTDVSLSMLPLHKGRCISCTSLKQAELYKNAIHSYLRSIGAFPYAFRGFSSERSGSRSESLSLSVPTFMVWGANTGVGKTLISAALARNALIEKVGVAWLVQRPSAFMRDVTSKGACMLQVPFLYIKPVQTGFPGDNDASLVVSFDSYPLQG